MCVIFNLTKISLDSLVVVSLSFLYVSTSPIYDLVLLPNFLPRIILFIAFLFFFALALTSTGT